MPGGPPSRATRPAARRPVRSAAAIIAAVEAPAPPLHLLLGRVAYDGVAAKLKAFADEMEAWREVSLGADFPAAE